MVRLRGVSISLISAFLIAGGFLLNSYDVLAAGDEPKEFMSWGIEAMGLDNAISAAEQKSDAAHLLVAVIDTGVNEAVFHEYFPDRNLSGYCVATCEDGMVDSTNHGTHVIGTITEGTPDNVDLLMIRVTETGSFSLGDLLTAIEYAINQGADIININAGIVFDFDNADHREAWELMQAKIDEAVEAGAIVVASAGDSGKDDVQYPASYDNVISVSAAERDLTRVNLSNYNEFIDYAAPGAGIMGLNASYGREGQGITTQDQGTSTAAAHVTAAVAALLSFNKDLSFDEVMELLNSKAIDLGETGKDDYFGNGFIDFSEAEFCIDGIDCDEYGVFVIREIPVPDTADDTAGSPDTGVFTRKNDGATTTASILSIIALVIVELWWIKRTVLFFLGDFFDSAE